MEKQLDNIVDYIDAKQIGLFIFLTDDIKFKSI